jgi:putative transposase
MRTMGLTALYPKRNLSLANQAHKVYPYLLRGLVIDRPNQVWATDITFSVPGVQGKQGCLNEPRVYLKYIVEAA